MGRENPDLKTRSPDYPVQFAGGAEFRCRCVGLPARDLPAAGEDGGGGGMGRRCFSFAGGHIHKIKLINRAHRGGEQTVYCLPKPNFN